MERRDTEDAESEPLGWGVRSWSGGRARGFALTPGGGRERQALPAWYRGVWCPQLRPLKKLGALEFSVCKALPLEVEASKTWSFRLPSQPGSLLTLIFLNFSSHRRGCRPPPTCPVALTGTSLHCSHSGTGQHLQTQQQGHGRRGE